MPQKYKLMIKDGWIKVINNGRIGELYHKDYMGLIEEGEVRLRPYEAVFLIYNDRAYIVDEHNKPLDLRDLLKKLISMDENVWLKFLIYNDLRRRGLLAREVEGRGIKFAVINKSKDDKIVSYYVYVIPEGEKVSFREIRNIINECIRLRKEPIIAIVDKEGNISYYSLSFFKGLLKAT
ncbi:MAG: hypothetical protein B6U69_02830 [Thermofilum sp. ex4484_15]|nr:MAG: hypothetical protein B6U69_02830 [Thermofilum sp. ex4484_15]